MVNLGQQARGYSTGPALLNSMNSKSFTIRPANKNDIAALAGLMTALGYPTTNEEMSTRFETIEREPGYRTFVAAVDEEVVGMAGACKSFYFEQNGCYVRLSALVTGEEHRNKGIGKALVAAVEDWARTINASSLILNCGNREERKAAHAFYVRNGFQPRSTGYAKRIADK